MPESQFKVVNRAALSGVQSILDRILPGGKMEGAEYVVKNPTRHDNRKGSFKINVNSGIWCDWATGDKGGDLISLCAYVRGSSQGDAMKELSEYLNISQPRARKIEWKPIVPVPGDAPKPPERHFRHGRYSSRWAYKTPGGGIVGYIYRFDTDDGKEILPLSFCASPNGKRKWQWKSFDKPRSLMNLDKLIHNPDKQVIVVEGEKCVEAAESILSNAIVTTWPGGCKVVRYADLSPLLGRKIVLWPDNDDPGLHAMLYIHATIKKSTPLIKILRIPEDKPAKWDVADAVAEGIDVPSFIRANLSDPVDIAARAPGMDGPHANVSHANGAKRKSVFDEAPFRCLGFNRGHFYYFPYETGQVIEMSADKHNKANLMVLAPLQWWESSFAGERGVSWTAAANALMRVCAAKGHYDLNRVRGCGAWFDGGKIVLHLGDRLNVEGKQMQIKDFESKYIYELSKATEMSDEKPLDMKSAHKLVEIAELCPFDKMIYAKFFAGWCVVAPICGALYWRPHIWITASTGVGKSWMMNNIVSPILGNAVVEVFSNTTEAGVRQELQNDAFPILFDEAENMDRASVERIKMVLELMRGSSMETRGKIIKGGKGGQPQSFRIRSCFCMGSITIPVHYKADKSRITILSLVPRHPLVRRSMFEELESKVNEVLSKTWCAQFRTRSIQMIKTIRENARTFGKAIAEHFSSQRTGDQLGTLLAGAYTLFSDDTISIDKAKKWVAEQDWTEQEEIEKENDEDSCMAKIMQYVLAVEYDGRRYDRSIIELIDFIANPTMDPVPKNGSLPEENIRQALLRIGIRITDDRLIISNSHEGIANILRDSSFPKNWNRVIERITGANKLGTARFVPGVITRATSIPLNYLFMEKSNEQNQ